MRSRSDAGPRTSPAAGPAPGPGSAPPAGSDDLLPSAAIAWGAAAVAFAICAALRQSAYWSDGRSLITLVEGGFWRYHIVGYLPAARVAHAVLGPLGTSAETSLALLSAACTGAAAGLVARAAVWLGAGPVASVAGALLTALAPTVLFFGTCVEVHAPQVLATSVALFLVARRERRGTEVDALAAALVFVAMCLAHTTSVLWAPAVLVYAFAATGRPRLPRRLVPGLVVLALAAGGWAWLTGDGRATGGGYVQTALRGVLKRWDAGMLGREFLGGGLLLATAALWFARAGARGRIALAAVVLPFAVAVPALGIEERGAYFASVFVVFGLVSGVALHALGRWALPVALVLVPLQGALGYREIWVWEHAYRGVEWMEPLAEEAGDDGLVLVLEPWEGDAVKKHSRMDALSLRIARIRGMEEVDPDAPGVTESSLRAVDAALTRGGIFAVTRSLVEHARERESVQRLLDRFAERYGEPVSTRREEYLVYPAREVPPR